MANIWGGMLGGAATGAGVGSMGGPTGMAIGAGVGALAGGYSSMEQQRAQEKKWKRQNSLYAKNIELSPWIGMQTQAPEEMNSPNNMQQVMQGVGTGAQLYGNVKQADANELLAKQQSDLNKAQIGYLQGMTPAQNALRSPASQAAPVAQASGLSSPMPQQSPYQSIPLSSPGQQGPMLLTPEQQMAADPRFRFNQLMQNPYGFNR